MGVMVMFNNKRLDGKGLVSIVDTTENGYTFLDVVETAKTTDATGSISVNGEEIPEGYFQLDMKNNSASLTTPALPWMVLDLDKVHVDINIYGDIGLCGKE